MTSIFLSYARGDDGEPFDPAASFVARLHRDLTTAGFDVWFDRASMPSRALTFHQEIRDAVAACDRLVLVVGPKAAESLYVRQEWQFAYFEAEKIVTPILRRGDYGNVPDELRLLHCEDCRDDTQYDFHLKNLMRQLAEPAPPIGKLIAVPSLPAHFLSRTDRLVVLRDALRADLDRPVVISGAAARIGMHGMGGIGKSVLAATLSRDRKIREAFPDGIVWVGLGPLPTVGDLQRRVHKDLGGDGAFQTEHEGRVKLRDILKDKSVLLILDDAWRREDVDWFDVLGPRCRATITTRDAGLLTSLGGVHHQVELLTDAESLNLLAQAAGVERDKLPSEAADLSAECGRLPLAVALCGGLIRHGFAWAKVLEQLRTSRIDRIKDPHAAKVEHENIWNAIDVSVKFLGADEQARFLELAVFPPDEATPIAALQTLWSHTAGFDDWDAEALVIKLSQRSLLELTPSAAGKAISLHDLVYDYVHRAAGDNAGLHQRLMEAYRKKCPDGWHVDPPNDGYFFTHLRQHLITAGRAGELADLLHELRWLEAKNEAGLSFDLTADFRVAIEALPASDSRLRTLRLLDEALRRDIHFIAQHASDYPQGLFQCLWNHGWWFDCPRAAGHYDLSKRTRTGSLPWESPPEYRLATLLERWRGEKERAKPEFIWVRSLRPPAVPLGTAQKMVLRGHKHHVMSVALSSDGRRIFSGAFDGTIRVWEAVSGQEQLCIRGRQGSSIASIYSIALRGDDRRIAGGFFADGSVVRIWDAATGQELLCLRGHESWVNGVAWSGDGRRLVSGSHDRTVRVWDAVSGQELLCLRGHQDEVCCVAWSGDGRRIASGSRDQTIRVWDAVGGQELLCLRGLEYCSFSCVVFSPDSTRLVSNSNGEDEWDTVKVWDTVSGRPILLLRGHTSDVKSVAWSGDGRRIVSGSGDKTIRVWDAVSGQELNCLHGHQSFVASVAASRDARWVVGGSSDCTVRVWDTADDQEVLTPFSYLNWVEAAPTYQALVRDAISSRASLTEEEASAYYRALLRRLETEQTARTGRTVAEEFDESVRLWAALVSNPHGKMMFETPARLPYTATRSGLKTEFHVTLSQCPIAYLPEGLENIAAHPSGRAWVAPIHSNYIAFVVLEGDSPLLRSHFPCHSAADRQI